MYIYKIVNRFTNKIYVGQTKRTLEKRLKTHFYEARVRKYNMYLHNSIRKHGIEHFSIELIEECSKDVVSDRERYWIKTLNTIQPNGYNEHEGGKGGCLNPSPELREKLSKAKRGKTPWNKGLTGKQIAWNKGLTKSDPRVAANGKSVSKIMKGRPKSKEHKIAISKAKKERSVLMTKDTPRTLE